MKINTFLIGVQKSGTSTFWNWLSQHPQIYGPEVIKDYHFFTRKVWYEKGINHLHHFYKDYQGESIVLHGGVNYYFEPEFLDHVLAYQPDGKYILILRDPVERAWSAYQYFTKLGQEKRTFPQALRNELEGNNAPEERHMYAYLEHGLYARHLRNLIDRISPERILILEYRELFKTPEAELRRTFEFLNVDPDFSVDTTVTKNKTGQARYAWFNELLFSKKGLTGLVKKYFPVQKLMPLSWRIRLGNTMRDANVRQGSDKSQLPEVQRIFMEEYFREDQAELKKLLKKEWEIEVTDRMTL